MAHLLTETYKIRIVVFKLQGLSDREVSNRTGASRKFECKNALEEEGLLLITNFVLDDLLILNNIVILLNK